MPQATDIILNGGLATPVGRTFALNTPSAGINSVAEWQYRKGNTPAGFPTITSSASRSKSGIRRTKIKLVVPYVVTDPVSGLPMVADKFEFNGDWAFGSMFPEDQKADAVAFFSNLLANSLIKSLIRDANPAT